MFKVIGSHSSTLKVNGDYGLLSEVKNQIIVQSF